MGIDSAVDYLVRLYNQVISSLYKDFVTAVFQFDYWITKMIFLLQQVF
jgi:hypothetical protein